MSYITHILRCNIRTQDVQVVTKVSSKRGTR